MRRSLAFLLLCSTVAAPAIAAIGTDGWDLEVEMTSRSWRPATIDWAQDLLSPTPTALEVGAIVPPPREMWCTTLDWDEDCGAWDYAMEQWLHHYLDIPYDEALPSTIPEFPKECSSSCTTW